MDDRRHLEVSRPKVQSFNDFVGSAGPTLFRLAYAKSGDIQDAEDVVQEVLTDAYHRWAEIQLLDFPLGWAHRAVLNKTISRWRRRATEHKTVIKLVNSDDTVHNDPAAFQDEDLWDAIRSLPDRQRDVVLLLWFEDQHVDVVATTLGCGPETVRTHWRRARATLAHELQESDHAEVESLEEP